MTLETKYLLALQLIPGLGNQRIRSFIKQTGTAEKLFQKSVSELKQLSGLGQTIAEAIANFSSWDLVDRILDKSESSDAQIIGFTDDVYPSQLSQIYDPPLTLWVRGSVSVLSTVGLAIVGSRNPSEYAKRVTVEFTKQAVAHGLTVNSGLAYGVDTIAHRVCTDLQSQTVAVLGSGIDVIYPSSNSGLVQKIVDCGGAVVSEYLPGTKPDAGNFPVRNRIVSGLSKGVLVVETSEKGGSRITANLALDQNRDVFIIPHPITNPNGTGCNELIKKGCGKLVQDFSDISEELQLERKANQLSPEKSHSIAVLNWRELPISDELKKICSVLENNISQIDDIAEQTGMSTQELLVRLLELEFQNIVVQRSGKNFFLA